MRQPSGFWESAFYYVGLALFGDVERTYDFLGALVLLYLTAAAFQGQLPRRDRWWYALGALCMGLTALLHVVHSRVLAGACLVLAAVLLPVGVLRLRRDRRSPQAR